jgi:2-polyprenyl-3-methyl-5-hydroxy-6-metoxy-1,4-benzoquinol methylase
VEERERKKYERIWATKEYRDAKSPGLIFLKRFPVLDWFEEYGVKSVLDAGCGSGKMLRRLRRLKPNLKLHGIDIANNAPSEDLRNLFTQGTLWDNSIYPEVDAIVCVDVMEHIPEQYIGHVLSNFSQFAEKFVFLSISLIPDNFGSYLIGEPLHLTLRDLSWWFQKFAKHGYEIKLCIGHKGSLEVMLVPG